MSAALTTSLELLKSHGFPAWLAKSGPLKYDGLTKSAIGAAPMTIGDELCWMQHDAALPKPTR